MVHFNNSPNLSADFIQYPKVLTKLGNLSKDKQYWDNISQLAPHYKNIGDDHFLRGVKRAAGAIGTRGALVGGSVTGLGNIAKTAIENRNKAPEEQQNLLKAGVYGIGSGFLAGGALGAGMGAVRGRQILGDVRASGSAFTSPRCIAFFSLDYKELAGAGIRSGLGGVATGTALSASIPKDKLEEDPYLPIKTGLSSAAVATGLGLYDNYMKQQERRKQEEAAQAQRRKERRSTLAALGTGAGLSAAAGLSLGMLGKKR